MVIKITRENPAGYRSAYGPVNAQGEVRKARVVSHSVWRQKAWNPAKSRLRAQPAAAGIGLEATAVAGSLVSIQRGERYNLPRPKGCLLIGSVAKFDGETMGALTPRSASPAGVSRLP